MINGDQIFIFSVCGGIIALPILAVIGVFLSQLYRKQNSSQQIPMEGATCTETRSGDLTIEGNRVRDGLIIGFFGGSLAVAVIGAVGASGRDRLPLILFALVWAAVTVPTLVRLSKALMNARYRFNASERTLLIRQGRKQRTIGFADLAGLKATAWKTELHLRYGKSNFYLARLDLTLKGGEILLLGRLSSYKGMDELLERTETITGLIAGMTGVGVTKVDQTEAAKA